MKVIQRLSTTHSRGIMVEKARAERNPKPKEQEPESERSLPILPVRDTVLFPHAVLPLTVGRESSVQLINSLGEAKAIDRKSTRLNSSHDQISYAVFCLKKKNKNMSA